jgi:hypothetical protein
MLYSRVVPRVKYWLSRRHAQRDTGCGNDSALSHLKLPSSLVPVTVRSVDLLPRIGWPAGRQAPTCSDTGTLELPTMAMQPRYLARFRVHSSTTAPCRW